MNSSNRWMTINSDGQKVTDPGELAALNAGKTVAAYHDAQQGDNYIHSWAVDAALRMPFGRQMRSSHFHLYGHILSEI